MPVFVEWMLEYYLHYRDGFLLQGGGVDDQPAWWMDAMRVFSREMNRAESESMKHGNH